MKQQTLKQGRMVLGFVLLGLITPVHSQPAGDFAMSVSGTIHTIALQPDGKILVKGSFQFLGGQPCKNFTRLNQDGTVDGTFNPTALVYSAFADCLAVHEDGKLLVGGQLYPSQIVLLNSDGSWDKSLTNSPPASQVFAIIEQADGKILTRNDHPVVQRFNPDGSRDTTFNPPTSSGWFDGLDEYVLGLQPNGEILLAGRAALVGQSALARLQPNGSLDTSFNPAAGGGYCLALQPDGRLLVGGGGLVRLNPDGSLDNSFNQPVVGMGRNRLVTGLVLQTDGKILVSGTFTNLGGQACTNFGRLNPDATLDTTFPSATYDVVDCLLLQPDGKLVFRAKVPTGPSGWPEILVRMTNPEPATQSLTKDGSTITWLRGGSSPEVWRTSFQFSTNGMDWTELGGGTRIMGGWQLTGLSLPPNCSVRARGYVVGAPNTDPPTDFGASSWFVQSQTTAPGIHNIHIATESLAMSPAGFRFTVAGPIGRQVVIAASTDFKHWIDISTNLLETGVFQFNDPTTSTDRVRYYRPRLQ